MIDLPLSTVDVASYPGCPSDDDLGAALWVMLVAADALGETQLTPAEISAGLHNGPRINISRQRIEGMLRQQPKLVSRKRVGGKWRYTLMQAGIGYLSQASAGVLFVEPEQALTQVRAIQDLFGQVTGIVRICDPYLAPRSLDFILECRSASELRLLTRQIQKQSAFVGDLKAARSELGVPITVKVAGASVLHDRYLIHDNGMLIFGTSLNGLGNKQTIVVEAGQDLRTMALGAFDRDWKSAVEL